MFTPNPQQIREICAEAICDERTARRAYKGKRIKGATRERLRRAAEVLNLPSPPVSDLEEVTP